MGIPEAALLCPQPPRLGSRLQVGVHSTDRAASTSLASPSVCQVMAARLKKAALFSRVALTSLPAGLFQKTSPHRLRSSLRPQVHAHIQWGMCALRQSRKKPACGGAGPGKSRARSQGALRNAPSDEKCRGQLPVGFMLPFGGRQPSELECGEGGWFLCRNSVGEGASDAVCCVRAKAQGTRLRGCPGDHLQGYRLLWEKPPPKGPHPASRVLRKASSSILVLIAYNMLGTLQPEWSGSIKSERPQEDRKDSSH